MNLIREDNNSFTIEQLISILWIDRKLVVIITSVAILLSLSIALLTDSRYRSVVVASPRLIDPTTNVSTSGLSGKLGGLSSILKSGPLSQDISKNLTILNARSTQYMFIRKSDIIHYMYKKQWDWKKKIWKINPPSPIIQKIYKFYDQLIGREKVRTYSEAPSMGLAYLQFQKWHETWYDEKRNLTYIAFYGPTGELAAKWAAEYLALTNSIIQRKRLAEANARVKYFENMLERVKYAEVRTNLMERLQDDLNVQAIAHITKEFAFETLDPATVPEFRYWPKRSLILVLGAFGGIILGSLTSLARQLYLHKGTRTPSPNQ